MGFNGWKLINSQIAYHERYIQVRKDELQSSQGELTDYVYLEDAIFGTVIILAVREDRHIPLVRQYRYPIQDFQYNLPGGMIDKGESPIQAAQRELREETGIIAEEWKEAGIYHPMASHHTRTTYLFLAKGLSMTQQDLDPYENIQVEWMQADEVVEKILDHGFTDLELGYAILYAKAKGLF